MNKTILIGMSALALTIGACAKRTPPGRRNSAAGDQTDPNSTDPDSL